MKKTTKDDLLQLQTMIEQPVTPEPIIAVKPLQNSLELYQINELFKNQLNYQ